MVAKVEKVEMVLPTPSMEDYLEKIYLLVEQKGYARAVDLAEALDVFPSSVSKMFQKLDEKEFGVYEKYRGFVLTAKGHKLAKHLAEKHEMLEDFLRMIGVREKNIYKEVEGLEHYISPETAHYISNLVDFFEEHPDIKSLFLNYRDETEPIEE